MRSDESNQCRLADIDCFHQRLYLQQIARRRTRRGDHGRPSHQPLAEQGVSTLPQGWQQEVSRPAGTTNHRPPVRTLFGPEPAGIHRSPRRHRARQRRLMFELVANTTHPDEVIDLTEDDSDYFAAAFHLVPRRHASRTERELAAMYA